MEVATLTFSGGLKNYKRQSASDYISWQNIFPIPPTTNQTPILRFVFLSVRQLLHFVIV